MKLASIIQQLDAEIARLQQARALVTGSVRATKEKSLGVLPLTKAPYKKHVVSAAGPEAIAEAQRKSQARQRTSNTIQVTIVPAQKEPGRRLRIPEQAAVGNALSSRSETVASPPARV